MRITINIEKLTSQDTSVKLFSFPGNNKVCKRLQFQLPMQNLELCYAFLVELWNFDESYKL